MGLINQKMTLYLMEVAIVISLFANNVDELLTELSKYVVTISSNSIKILSFMSIGLFGYYAKEFSCHHDS